MTDSKRLYKDFDKFWKRYKYKYGKNIDYLAIVEPQERGAWHMHVLIRHNEHQGKIYIPNAEISGLWGHGYTSTRATDKVDNMGAYLTAYLTDVELTEENHMNAVKNKSDIKVIEVEGTEKKFIKGARVHLYPSGMNIFRHSKGIKPPETEEMTYKIAKKIVGNKNPNYSTTTAIVDGDKLLNKITYEHYNLKRKSF
jgi:hypothetical protein